MPRRSTRQTTVAATEQAGVRVTRRSVREQKAEKEDEVAQSPAKSDTSKSSRRSTKSHVEVSPTVTTPPTKGSGRSTGAASDTRSPRGRGRGRRGRGQSRTKGWSRKIQDEEDSEEVDETPSESGDQDFELKPSQQPKPQERSPGSSARGRRGQSRKSHDEEEEEYQPEQKEVKKLKTPSPRKTTRKGRSAVKEQEEDESPRRRSGRRAAKEAEEKIRTEAAAEEASKEDEEEPMETETTEEKPADDQQVSDRDKQVKRKLDQVEGGEDDAEGKTAFPVKKLKTEQSTGEDTKSTDESMPNIEEISEESAGEELAKETSGVSKMDKQAMEEAPVLEAEEKTGDTAIQDEPMKIDSSPEQPKHAEPAAVEKPQKCIGSPSLEESSEVKSDDGQMKTSPSKDGQAPTVSASADKAAHSEVPATEGLPSGSQEKASKAANQSSKKEANDGSQTVQDSSSKSQDADTLKDFVVINMEDVPAPDSSEVSKSIPEVRIIPPEQDNNIDHGEKHDSGSTNQAPTPSEAAPHEATPAANSVSSSPSASSPSNKQPSDCNNVIGDCHHADKLVNNSTAKTDNQDPLLCRRFLPNPAVDLNSVPPEKTFTLVSYNILADCHAQRGEYQWISEEHLSVEYRHQRLMKELKYLDADIICIQEIGPDHYNKLLQPQLSQLGYQGAYIKRPDDYFNEGEATFVRTGRFTVVSSELIDLSSIAKRDLDNSSIEQTTLEALKKSVSSPGVAVITKLKCTKTGRTLTIGNVHIMWEWFKRMDIQCVQAAATIRELVTLAGGASQPHIVCGDFNAVPGSPVYQLTHEGYLNDDSMAKLQQLSEVKLVDGRVCPMVNLWWRGFQHTSSNLKSAYFTATGSEPMSSKFPHDGIVRQVDYIWYSSGSLEVLGVAETAPLADIQQGIPNAIYPSDHVSTKAMLAFRD